jgi:Domain of unknown function (DUF4349)
MKPHRDDQLIADLQTLRPTPRPQFAAELDERAAAGFPRRGRKGAPAFSFAMRMKWPEHPLRVLIPVGGVAALAIILVSSLIVASEHDPQPQGNLALLEPQREPAATPPQAPNRAGGAGSASSGKEASEVQYEAEVTTLGSKASGGGSAANGAVSGTAAAPELQPFSEQVHRRAVEYSAEVVLAADPADVGEDSSQVFEVVHAHNGIVMRSSTREGKPGQAGARFELLIPSDGLSDSLAALSAIDEVRSRHEATTDITAPTVSTGELLRDSQARIDSLLAQLEGAETEGEREAVEAELSQERRHRARLRGSLQHLQHRAAFSRVSLRIETGKQQESSDSGAWGIGDAFHDAGQVLTVAAAVTLIGLAILGPIALIALLAWLSHRAWVQRERRRVLS